MSAGSNTHPEKIVDKNGKQTTVHKGKSVAPSAGANSRIGALSYPRVLHKTLPLPLAKGSHFSAVYADSAIQYTIVSVKKNVVETVSDDEDWGKMTRLFTREEATASLVREAQYKNMAEESNHFWNSREDGEIVHYHNGFGQIVRGEIVTDSEGEKQMRPIALIGPWGSVSGRRENGDEWRSHHVERILKDTESALMKPHQSNMWESMDEVSRSSPKFDFIREAGGIENVPVIDFSIPPLTDEMERGKMIEKKGKELESAATAAGGYPIAERIALVRKLADELEALANS